MKTPSQREIDAKKILELRRQGLTYQKIAEQIGCSIGTVFNVSKGRTWKSLQPQAI
jgi:DNA-binding NarL/FixJ family response regulator